MVVVWKQELEMSERKTSAFYIHIEYILYTYVFYLHMVKRDLLNRKRNNGRRI